MSIGQTLTITIKARIKEYIKKVSSVSGLSMSGYVKQLIIKDYYNSSHSIELPKGSYVLPITHINLTTNTITVELTSDILTSGINTDITTITYDRDV